MWFRTLSIVFLLCDGMRDAQSVMLDQQANKKTTQIQAYSAKSEKQW